uniref:WASP homolog associated with actin, golgi membranes and microtubules n=1 Tax=Hippocampus comes TaxID=109280 RepID=A0A3Q2ZB92_HIPCM
LSFKIENAFICERPDSLDGWVAIKSNIFEEPEVFKLGFIVQWNVIECKFAVTCHNRTLQRRNRKEEFSLTGEHQSSWAGLFSVSDLKHIHQQLMCVSDVLAPCFPDLSEFEDGSVWDLLFPSRKYGSDDERRLSDAPCRKLEKYLSTAIDVCGRTIVLDTLFYQDERDVDDYFENLQELKRKSMHDEMSRAKGHLRQLLQSHGGADRMVTLLAIYAQEDEAYQDLLTEATAFFQYLLQPFRDMRELACLYKMEILKSLEFDDLGPKRIEALEGEAEEWRAKAEDAVVSIQDITVTYFAQTSKALAGMVKQMEEDKHRFGTAAWASAAPRLEKLRFLLAKEALQHMRSTEMCLNSKKASIKKEQDQQQDTVDRLELQFYGTQLELYNTKFEILKNEEQLLVTQTDTLRRQIKELKEEVVYYDVCEDPEELHSMVDTGLHHTEPPAIRQLKKRLQNLETKRGNICARRAYLRNKKVPRVNIKNAQSVVTLSVFNICLFVLLLISPKKRPGQYVLKSRRSPTESSCPSQPLSIISLGPPSSSDGLPSIRPAPRRKTLPVKAQPRDVSVQIYPSPPPPLSGKTSTVPSTPPPPPPLPPPLRPPPPPPSSFSTSREDKPMPLSDREEPPFPPSSFFLSFLLWRMKVVNKRLICVVAIGPMDEVLASLQRGQIRLRKAPAPGIPPPSGDQRSSLMSAIRQGVTLKKVRCSTQDNELERHIKAAMMRMKKVSADSDDEDKGDEDAHSGDWDS